MVSCLWNNNFLVAIKFNVFVDLKIPATQMFKLVFLGLENILGKEENAGFQDFLIFPQCFQKTFFPRAVKTPVVVR